MTTTLMVPDQEVDQALVDLLGCEQSNLKDSDYLRPDNQVMVSLDAGFEAYIDMLSGAGIFEDYIGNFKRYRAKPQDTLFNCNDSGQYRQSTVDKIHKLPNLLNNATGSLTDKMFVNQLPDWEDEMSALGYDPWNKFPEGSAEKADTCLAQEGVHLIALSNHKTTARISGYDNIGPMRVVLVAKMLTPNLYWLFVSGCPKVVDADNLGSNHQFDDHIHDWHFNAGALFYVFMYRLAFHLNSDAHNTERLRNCHLIMSRGLQKTLVEFLLSHSLCMKTEVQPYSKELNTLTTSVNIG